MVIILDGDLAEKDVIFSTVTDALNTCKYENVTKFLNHYPLGSVIVHSFKAVMKQHWNSENVESILQSNDLNTDRVSLFVDDNFTAELRRHSSIHKLTGNENKYISS